MPGVQQQVLSPDAVRELMADNSRLRILDVRTPAEFESAHIEGAYNVPLDTLSEHAVEIRGVSDPVVLVCQSGARARRAEVALKRAGMPNLHVLDGGMNRWIARGFPVREGSRRLSLERQVRIAAGALAALGAVLALLVDHRFALLPAFIGGGLVFAGVTDRCGLAIVLSHMPYNRPATCDVDAMVDALRSGETPAKTGRATAPRPTRTCATN